jgi:hypothetical protein
VFEIRVTDAEASVLDGLLREYFGRADVKLTVDGISLTAQAHRTQEFKVVRVPTTETPEEYGARQDRNLFDIIVKRHPEYLSEAPHD